MQISVTQLAQVLVSILSQDAVNTNVLASDEVQRELGAALAKITFLKVIRRLFLMCATKIVSNNFDIREVPRITGPRTSNGT